MDQHEAVRLAAFFDELGELEKRAMMEKVAVGTNPMALGNLARTGLLMLKNPRQAGKTVKGIWQSGVKDLPKDTDFLTRMGKGMGALWKTPGGRAAVLTGGAAGATALAGGSAALGGARGGGNRQNVYVQR